MKPRMFLPWRLMAIILSAWVFSPVWGAEPKADAESKIGQVFDSIHLNDDAKLKSLLEQKLDLNTRRRGLTPLDLARLLGNAEAEKLLIAGGADTSIPFPEPQKVADQFLTESVRTNGAGVVVLVARDGRLLYQRAAGLAQLEPSAALQTDSRFRIGSVTKQFVAAAILKLQEQGKLNVNDKLSKYYPDFPRAEEVTIHHLLTHTSGIHSYTSKPEFMKRVTNSITPAELIQWFRDDAYDFSPGERWAYNNSGYFLLGEIIGKVSGKPWGEFLRSEFFQPLGMKDTGVYTNRVTIEKEAIGHSWIEGEFKRAMDWDMSWAGGAGALYSTVGDLQRWAEAVMAGRVIKSESLRAAWTPVTTAKDQQQLETGYGYGWMMSKTRGLKVVEHGGGLHGFSTMLKTIPEKGIVVVVLANALPGVPAVDPGETAGRLAALFFWREMKPLEAKVVNTTVAKSTYDALLGRYDYGTAVLTVTRDGDRLFAQLTGQPPFEIYPKSETEFFWKVTEASVKFEKDKDGKVTHAVHSQNGAQIHARRLPASISLKAEALEALVGRYEYSPGVVGAVTREGNRLFMQLTGQPKMELFAESENRFFWKDVAAAITFVRNDQGKVIHGKHEQGGQTLTVKRLD